MARTRGVQPNDSLPETVQRVRVEHVHPQLDGGRHPVKRVVGDRLVVEADLVADGHDDVGGLVRFRHEQDEGWSEIRLSPLGNDRWRAQIVLDRLGRWSYQVEGWIEPFASWQRGLGLKVDANQNVAVDILIGAELVEAAAARAKDVDARELKAVAKLLRSETRDLGERVDAALSTKLQALMIRWPDRSHSTHSDRALEVVVDPMRARFSAWYEFFPRSTGAADRHGTLRDAVTMLPYISQMGFDVVYLPPIHPIGRTHRKGRNNSLTSQPGDPGSPWAIGAAEGGHTAIHPDLGSFEDFEFFRKSAADHGLEVALDIAFQASPDHPWVREHPEWFKKRPDGSIQYAENPPKKYQDIYPLDFESEDWRGLWQELLGVFSFWIEKGVRIFRVDNPHTKSLQFWEWCISQIKSRHPDVLLLAEAFTRPKLMYALAKLGFSQSYTYFTWRNASWELQQYMDELTRTEVAEFFRPNFWPNTPDILPEHLQHGGRAAFLSRFVLASTLSSNYGMYGPAFECMEHVARPESEEYLNNEKYELRCWNLDGVDSLRPIIARINRIRRQNSALQGMSGYTNHRCDNPQLLCYSKRDAEQNNAVLVVVNLDHHHPQSGWLDLDLPALGLREGSSFHVHDMISDERYHWHGNRAFVALDPAVMPAHVLHVTK